MMSEVVSSPSSTNWLGARAARREDQAVHTPPVASESSFFAALRPPPSSEAEVPGPEALAAISVRYVIE